MSQPPVDGPEGVVDAARAVWSEVDLDAIRANVAALRARSPSPRRCSRW